MCGSNFIISNARHYNRPREFAYLTPKSLFTRLLLPQTKDCIAECHGHLLWCIMLVSVRRSCERMAVSAENIYIYLFSFHLYNFAPPISHRYFESGISSLCTARISPCLTFDETEANLPKQSHTRERISFLFFILVLCSLVLLSFKIDTSGDKRLQKRVFTSKL